MVNGWQAAPATAPRILSWQPGVSLAWHQQKAFVQKN